MGGKGEAKNKSSVDLEIENIYSKAGMVEKDADMDSLVQYSNPMHDKEVVDRLQASLTEKDEQLEAFKVKMDEQLAVKDEQLEALNKKIKALEAKVEDSTTADDTKQGAFPTTQDMKQSDEVPL